MSGQPLLPEELPDSQPDEPKRFVVGDGKTEIVDPDRKHAGYWPNQPASWESVRGAHDESAEKLQEAMFRLGKSMQRMTDAFTVFGSTAWDLYFSEDFSSIDPDEAKKREARQRSHDDLIRQRRLARGSKKGRF